MLAGEYTANAFQWVSSSSSYSISTKKHTAHSWNKESWTLSIYAYMKMLRRRRLNAGENFIWKSYNSKKVNVFFLFIFGLTICSSLNSAFFSLTHALTIVYTPRNNVAIHISCESECECVCVYWNADNRFHTLANTWYLKLFVWTNVYMCVHSLFCTFHFLLYVILCGIFWDVFSFLFADYYCFFPFTRLTVFYSPKTVNTKIVDVNFFARALTHTTSH